MEQLNILDLFAGADNVYLTPNYIVIQQIIVTEVGLKEAEIVSYDTYIRRSKSRDFAYHLSYHDKQVFCGRRLPSTLYTRTYID